MGRLKVGQAPAGDIGTQNWLGQLPVHKEEMFEDNIEMAFYELLVLLKFLVHSNNQV